MRKVGIWVVVLAIIVLSGILATVFYNPKLHDWAALFIGSLGSVATVTAIVVAYKIFLSYSAQADIQKKKFQLVEDAYTFLISQMLEFTNPESWLLLFLTPDRMDYFREKVENKDIDLNEMIFIDRGVYAFCTEVNNKSNQLYFPESLRKKIKSRLPSNIRPEKLKRNSSKLEIKSGNDENRFGIPIKLIEREGSWDESDMTIGDLVLGLMDVGMNLRFF